MWKSSAILRKKVDPKDRGVRKLIEVPVGLEADVKREDERKKTTGTWRTHNSA